MLEIGIKLNLGSLISPDRNKIDYESLDCNETDLEGLSISLYIISSFFSTKTTGSSTSKISSSDLKCFFMGDLGVFGCDCISSPSEFLTALPKSSEDLFSLL